MIFGGVGAGGPNWEGDRGGRRVMAGSQMRHGFWVRSTRW